MPKKRTTSKEREEFLRQQQKRDANTAFDQGAEEGVVAHDFISGLRRVGSYLAGNIHVPPGDMSFIVREGNIIKHTRESYKASLGKKGSYEREGKGSEGSRGPDYRTLAIISLAGILSGIFFLSTNITGNAIVDLTTKTTSFLGAGLLIVGLISGFFWIKSRKK